MLQFLKQHILLSQERVLLEEQMLPFALQGAPRSYIFNAQQKGGVRISLVENLAGIQQHGAFADVGKLILHLVVIHHAMLRNDFLQEQSKARDVPLTIAQRIKQPAMGVGPVDLECEVE